MAPTAFSAWAASLSVAKPTFWIEAASIQRADKRLQGTSVDYIIKHYCKKIGIAAGISPHSARATVIGSLLDSGCDLYKVSQLVNHSNVKTTQGYDKRKKSLIDSPVFKLNYF